MNDAVPQISGYSSLASFVLLCSYIAYKFCKHSRCKSMCCGQETGIRIDLENGSTPLIDEKPVISCVSTRPSLSLSTPWATWTPFLCCSPTLQTWYCRRWPRFFLSALYNGREETPYIHGKDMLFSRQRRILARQATQRNASLLRSARTIQQTHVLRRQTMAQSLVVQWDDGRNETPEIIIIIFVRCEDLLDRFLKYIRAMFRRRNILNKIFYKFSI